MKRSFLAFQPPFFKFALILFFASFFLSRGPLQMPSAFSGSAAVSPKDKTPAGVSYENYEVLLNKGMTAAREGFWMDACAAFQSAVSSRQDFSASYLALGASYLKLGRMKEAAESFERLALLKISSGEDAAGAELDGRIHAQFLEDAIETCRQIIIIIPHSFEINSCRASLAVYAGNSAEAVEYYRRLLGIKPDYADANYYLGAMYHKLGDYRRSIEELKKYSAVDAENAEARMLMGLNYVMLKEVAPAKDEYKILNALDKEKGRLLKELIDLREKSLSGKKVPAIDR